MSRWAPLAAAVLAGCGGDYGFRRVDFGTEDPRRVRLCDEESDPDAAPDKVQIHCRMESGAVAAESAPLPEALTVYTYNIERGLELDAQLEALRSGAIGPEPDVMLLQEVDRGCSRTGFREVVRELGEALQMDYVFAVEYVELPRPSGGGGEITTLCEHGNAILSRFPLGNAGAFRHAKNQSWYQPPEKRNQPGEPRLGGNIDVFADARIGGQIGARIIHLFSVHYDIDLDTHFEVQVGQARETVAETLVRPYPVIAGGDTNAATYSFDLANDAHSDQTIRPFLDHGFVDAHAGLPARERGTRAGAIVDLILLRGLPEISDRGICPEETCGGLSDHLPVWAKIRL